MRSRIRTATLSGFARLSRSLLLDPVELVTEVGLSVADLDAGDRLIPAAPAARLLELAAERSGVPDFALRLVDFRQLGTLGRIGVVVRDEPDLRGALRVLVDHDQTYAQAFHMRMGIDGSLVTIEVWLQFGEPAPTGQALDLAMGAVVDTIRTLVGRDWRPLSAAFGHPAPADPAPWCDRFGPRVRFDQDHTVLVFPVRDLDLPVAISDPSLRRYTHELLDAVVTDARGGIAAETARAVEVLLPAGGASADQVGRRLGMSPRQLQRALGIEGETFSGVVNGVRADLAERYLSSGRCTVTELSQQLGFAAPSALSRWFRQQFGTSPTAWRDAAAAGAEASPGTVPPPHPR